jgi:hypothetical protein
MSRFFPPTLSTLSPHSSRRHKRRPCSARKGDGSLPSAAKRGEEATALATMPLAAAPQPLPSETIYSPALQHHRGPSGTPHTAALRHCPNHNLIIELPRAVSKRRARHPQMARSSWTRFFGEDRGGQRPEGGIRRIGICSQPLQAESKPPAQNRRQPPALYHP